MIDCGEMHPIIDELCDLHLYVAFKMIEWGLL